MKVVNDIPYVSASRIKMWEKCKHQFYLNYIVPLSEGKDSESDKSDVIGQEDEIYFVFGGIVHEAIENFWNSTKRTKKTLFELYEESFTKNALADKSYFDLGYELLGNYFFYLINEAPKRKLIAQELEIDFMLGDARVKGRIDSIFYLGNGVYEIVDYKTNKWLPTQDDVDADIQMAIYDIAFREDPNMKKYWINGVEPKAVLLTMHFLHHYPMHTEYTREERKVNRTYIQVVYKQMQILRAEQFVATLNRLCNWCDKRYECTAFTNALENDEIEDIEEYDIDDFTDRLSLISEYESRIKALNAELESLKDDLVEVFNDCAEDNSLIVGDKEYYMHQSSRRNLNLKMVVKILEKEGLWDPFDYINYLPISKVEKVVGDREDVMFKIERKAMFKTPSSPSLKSKKVKKR